MGATSTHHRPGTHVTALVLQAQCGETDAQELLWKEHQRWLAVILLAHRPRGTDLEDLMQDVALQFVNSIASLRNPEALRPWLRRIAINTCRGTARKQRPAGAIVLDSEGCRNVPDRESRTAPEQLMAGEERDRLIAHVQTLPEIYREPLLLRGLRSLAYRDIADILDLSIAAVETRIARARRMLREESPPSMTQRDQAQEPSHQQELAP